jgi:transcriptional regulator with XRE-family HTH domain
VPLILVQLIVQVKSENCTVQKAVLVVRSEVVMSEACAMAYAEALRGFISHLRKEQDVSQRALAEAIGVARGTYIAWETGETKDLKVPLMVRALRFFGVPLDHLEGLATVDTEEEGRELADKWLKLSPEERAQQERIHTKFRRVVELGDKDPEKLEQVVERLRADARADPAILDMVMGYLDGRRSP